ncbi:MAG: class I SAM-dependent methyltransferase, partial [Candidatus Eiseniibacteriota bacterium]
MAPLWLKDWPVDSGKRNAYVDAVFRRVAPRYDRLTRLLSFGREESWKEAAVGLLSPDGADRRILDLATGTGAFPILLRRRGHRGAIVGLDRSRDMMALARAKDPS